MTLWHLDMTHEEWLTPSERSHMEASTHSNLLAAANAGCCASAHSLLPDTLKHMGPTRAGRDQGPASLAWQPTNPAVNPSSRYLSLAEYASRRDACTLWHLQKLSTQGFFRLRPGLRLWQKALLAAVLLAFLASTGVAGWQLARIQVSTGALAWCGCRLGSSKLWLRTGTEPLSTLARHMGCRATHCGSA